MQQNPYEINFVKTNCRVMVNADILKYSAADPVGQVNPVVLWKDAIRNSLQ